MGNQTFTKTADSKTSTTVFEATLNYI